MAGPYISFLDIIDYVGDGQRCIIEGEQVLNAKHIVCCGVKEKQSTTTRLLALCLQTSDLQGKPHEITVNISEDLTKENKFSIICTCKAGKSKKCKHCFAVLLLLNRTDRDDLEILTCTDLTQAWGISKSISKELYEPCPLEDFCHVSKKQPIVLPAEVQDGIRANLMQCAPQSAIALHSKGRETSRFRKEQEQTKRADDSEKQRTEITALIQYATQSNTSLQPIVNSESDFELNQKDSMFYSNCVIHTETDSIILCEKTLGQSGTEWMKARESRITGSKCYALYTFKQLDWSEKVLKHFDGFNFKGNAATRHGVVHEPKAIEQYMKVKNRSVKCFGVVVNPLAPFLAFSPDGVVFKNGKPDILIEVKCPVLGKSKSINEIAESNEMKFLKKENGSFILKEKHQYYGQIQLGLAILNLEECHLVCFSSMDCEVLIVTVKKNNDFINRLLQKLKLVYFNYLLPYMAPTLQ